MEFVRGRGRRARDEVRVLPYALGGEKSVNGGIYGPSVAPHLNRKPLREVRSEFSWTADGAAYSDACGRGGRAARSFASFGTFLSNKEKFINPFPRGEREIARTGVWWRFWSNTSPTAIAVPPPPLGSVKRSLRSLRREINSVRGREFGE